MSVTNSYYQTLASALAENTGLDVDTIAPLLETPRNRDFGDIAFPCFILAKALKKSPPECATQISESLTLPECFSSVSATGPFLNFSLKRDRAVADIVSHSQRTQESISEETSPKQTVLVEYSSPNIAKPFHVGHLRATLIGNCIDRVYRFLGHSVTSINHLGDWGTQFGFVYAGCELWGKPKDSSVRGLLEIYRKATALKAEQEAAPELVTNESPDINLLARQYFIDLEAGEEYALAFWKWCSEISLQYFKDTYKRLNVSFDHYTGESFYSAMLPEVSEWLKAGGLLVESDNALGVDLDELGFARVLTPDGRSLYLTRDIATARYRAKTFQFDRAIYVVGAPQTLHFQQLKAILERMGEDYAQKIHHVAFGHVQGIKTRGEGQFFELNEFLDEAFQRARTAYHEQVSKRPEGLNEEEIATAVGLSAIVFGNLSRTNIKDVHFDWDSALALQGDSGPYLLYAYARITGIKERALAAGVSPASTPNATAYDSSAAYYLAEHIDGFQTVLAHTAEQHEPALLANYALELAKLVSKAYLDLKVVGEAPEIAASRLSLFVAAQRVLGHCIELLGMSRLERM